MLRILSDVKNFELDQENNKQNHRWICKDIEEDHVVELTSSPSPVMAPGVISNKGHVIQSAPTKRTG